MKYLLIIIAIVSAIVMAQFRLISPQEAVAARAATKTPTPSTSPTAGHAPTSKPTITPVKPSEYPKQVRFEYDLKGLGIELYNDLGNYYNNYSCLTFSLNEQLNAVKTGSTAPGCTFSIQTGMLGEWGHVGGWQGSPPYGWGKDNWYDDPDYTIIGDGINCYPGICQFPVAFSTTCGQPEYTVNAASLPSYVKMVRNKDVEGNPNEKKFTFKVSDDAHDNANFNVEFLAVSQCDMRMKSRNKSVTMKAITSEGACMYGKWLDFNPRQASKKMALTVSGTPCAAPTSTSVPTKVPCGGDCSSSDQCVEQCPICSGDGKCVAAPTPTPTKVPCGGPCSSDTQCVEQCPICTAGGTCEAIPTPTPTLVPCGGDCSSSDQCVEQCPICSAEKKCIAPPTPTLPPSCDCFGMTVRGNIAVGSTVTYSAKAKVDNPATNNTVVLNMVYRLTKDGTEVSRSGEIVPPAPVRGVDPATNVPIDVYTTAWSRPITASGSYKAYADIHCQRKSAYSGSELASAFQAVLGEAVVAQNKGFFASLSEWIASFFTSTSKSQPKMQSLPTLTPTVTPFIPDEASSLKLKDFDPNSYSNLQQGCKWVSFDVSDAPEF